ncbi:MAG: membrane protein insertion efficiency factor YidD [Deltaproteobacteria bacterium]
MLRIPLMLLIRVYRLLISPILPPSCRFYPSCSEYAHEAIENHGALAGIFLSAKRISRCHPYSAGGFDPVPKDSFIKSSQQQKNTETNR